MASRSWTSWKIGAAALIGRALLLCAYGCVAQIALGIGIADHAIAADLTPIEQLGKRLFFDRNLSNPRGQSCASCHDPAAGFTGPESTVNSQTAVHPGAARGRFGNRKPPSAAYAAYGPPFHLESKPGKDPENVGGQFWDGRARDLAEQAGKPLLNPLEQNNADVRELFDKIRNSDYRDLFERVHERGSLDDDLENVNQIVPRVSAAIAAYESSREVNPFSSKYDAYLAGKSKLTAQEARGLALFQGQAKCTNCHPNKPSEDGTPPLFTDFTYDNLGVPRNAQNPFYHMPKSVNPDGDKFVDRGLGAILNDPNLYGQFKAPTLRNVDRRPSADFVKAYMHNGYFKTLKDVVHFYNTRDSEPQNYPPAEVPETVNHDELGNLGLSDEDEDAIVAFLQTLTDGYGETPEPQGTAADPTIVENSGLATDDSPHFESAVDAVRIQRFLHNKRRIAAEEAARKSRRR